MMSQKINKSKKMITILGAIFVSFLFISTATAVPQVQSQGVMEKITQKENFETMLKGITNEVDTSTGDTQSLSILNNIGTQDITSFLETLLALLVEYITQYIQNNGGTLPTFEGGFLNLIITILQTIATFALTLFQVLFNASAGLIGGILTIIRAFITIIFLILANIQTALTLVAILMLFIGIMSKIGIKALVIIGAPLFALFAAQMAISTGTILSGISVAFFSILSILFVLALPLALIFGALYLINPEGIDWDGIDLNLDFNPPDRIGLIYMILSSIFSNFTDE